jgi:S1-C subfamily serine protease
MPTRPAGRHQGPLRAQSLPAGDVIAAVQGVKVTTPEQLRQIVLKAHDEGRPYAAVLINGRLGTRWIPMSLGGSDVP